MYIILQYVFNHCAVQGITDQLLSKKNIKIRDFFCNRIE